MDDPPSWMSGHLMSFHFPIQGRDVTRQRGLQWSEPQHQREKHGQQFFRMPVHEV